MNQKKGRNMKTLLIITTLLFTSCSKKYLSEAKTSKKVATDYTKTWLKKNSEYLKKEAGIKLSLLSVKMDNSFPVVTLIDQYKNKWDLLLVKQRTKHSQDKIITTIMTKSDWKSVEHNGLYVKELRRSDRKRIWNFITDVDDRLFFNFNELEKGVTRSAVSLLYNCNSDNTICRRGNVQVKIEYKENRVHRLTQ